MEAKIVEKVRYNGMFCQTEPIPEDNQRTVTILGVMSPVDPGIVTVQDGKRQYQIPCFAIKPCPRIDFEAMLSEEQKLIRKRVGGLLFSGVGSERKLIPLDQCPMITD